MMKTEQGVARLMAAATRVIAKQRADVLAKLAAAGYTLDDARRMGADILPPSMARGALRVWLRELAA